MLRRVLVALGLLSFAGASVAAAQQAYVVADLGRAPEPPLSPPSSSFIANGNGQITMKLFRSGLQGSGFRGAFWEPGLSQPLFFRVNTTDTQQLYGISSNGIVIGLNDGGVPVPFKWSRSGGMTALFGHDIYYPLGVNASGIVVGMQSGGAFPRAGVWYTPDVFTFIDDLTIEGGGPWNGFEQALSISDAGVIVGIGRLMTSAGTVETHYFALTPATGGGGGGTPLDRSDWTVIATQFSAADPPSNAIDGNLNTRFSTGQAQHDSQGFAVSWPGDRTISRIRFEVGPSTGDYPRTCGIWVTDTNGNVTQLPCQADGSGNVDVSFAALPVQKIEVWQWGSAPQWWSIAEFNAFK